MPKLHSTLQDLARSFASAVLDAIRAASLQELRAEGAAPRRGPATMPSAAASRPFTSKKKARIVNGKLARRSPADVEQTLGLVVAVLKAPGAEGMRAEEIRASLGLHRTELPRVLKLGLEKELLQKKGQKRATTYYAG